jgi:hypothetical protein
LIGSAVYAMNLIKRNNMMKDGVPPNKVYRGNSSKTIKERRSNKKKMETSCGSTKIKDR